MSDARLRQLEREAQGDPAARVALLRARVRAGTLSQERLELAAYAGDVDARRAATPWCPCGPALLRLTPAERARHIVWCWVHDPGAGLRSWAFGLQHWGVGVRASAAAARLALPVWASGECEDAHSSHPDWQAPLRHLRLVCGTAARARDSLEAAEAWLACPCEKHLQAWRTACSLIVMGRCPWLPHALMADQPERVESLRASVEAAARLAGEGPVREAIRAALVAWSLGT